MMTTKLRAIRGGAGDTTAAESARVQDNLYLSVNGEWAKTAEIPADRPRTGGFSDLDEGVEKQMLADFAGFRAHPEAVKNLLLSEAVKLNTLALDFKNVMLTALNQLQPCSKKLRRLRAGLISTNN
jgi:Predicted metalloendopeptidase